MLGKIQDLKKEIQEEIEENLLGKHLIFKEDYVKIYITNLSNLHDKILSLNFFAIVSYRLGSKSV